MGRCHAGTRCDRVHATTILPAVADADMVGNYLRDLRAAVDRNRPFTQCLQWRDELRNHAFLRNASVVLGVGGIGTGVWALTHSGATRKNGMWVGGGVTALGVAGIVHQRHNINAVQLSFLANNCPELIERVQNASSVSSVSQAHFSDVTDLCWGAAVLTRSCMPVRTLPKVDEYSTDIKAIQRQQMIIGGILVAPAVALCVAAAGASVLASGSETLAAALNAARLLAAPL